MEGEIKKYLQILNSGKLDKKRNIQQIVDKICQCFKQEQSQFNISLLIGQVMDEEDGLLEFLQQTSFEPKIVNSVTGVFKILEFLVCEYQNLVEPYFKIIFQKCVNLLESDINKIKEQSLRFLKLLLKIKSRVILDLVLLISTLEKILKCATSGTITEQIFSIFGLLCDKFPESVKKKNVYIFSRLYETLYYEINVAKSPSLLKIKGAFDAMNGFLKNYLPTDSDKVSKLYEFIKKFSKYKAENRFVGFIVLKILQNHWIYFVKYVFEDRETWKENLEVWISQGTEECQNAFCGYKGYYNIISTFVKQNPSHAPILEHFLKDLKETLFSSIVNSYEKSSALVGIKLFVLNGCLQGNVFNEYLDLILDFSKKQDSLQNFSYLPLCVECIAAFIFKSPSNEISEEIFLLQRMSVVLIEQYPKNDVKNQESILTALEMSFYMICSSNLLLIETHLDKVLYVGLMKTCSALTMDDFDIFKEQCNTLDAVTHKSYLNLWKYLLNLPHSSNNPPGNSFNLKNGVCTKVTDVLIMSFLQIISRLDLKVSLKEEESELIMEIQNPSDFKIFINIIDLYQDLLPEIDIFKIVKWLPDILETMVQFSGKYPLVAGFYKIIATTFRISEKVQFFETENQKLFNLVSRFLDQVIFKVSQYKGDLQIVCLQLLLAAPAPLIEPLVDRIIPVLELAIILGRTHFYLLKNLVETLGHWYSFFSPVNARLVMKKILPSFDLFFQSQYFQGNNLGDNNRRENPKNTNNLGDSRFEGKKLKKKLIFNDSELLSLQKKFLLFLGSIDMNLALYLLGEPQIVDERKIGARKFSYKSPFGEGNTSVNLNELLPRIIDLSLSCSNRQTRIFACELFYSTVMIVLDDINKLSCNYTDLFRKIVRTCVMLASDSDIIVFQIYEPLIFQIIHYFSSRKAINFTETGDVIDILMETVTGPYNTGARDLAALLLREFIEWVIKQLTPEELTTTPKYVLKIINNIYSLAIHPSYTKRVGAAIVFNKIYSVVVEELDILDRHWFQLYYYFMESLRMCDESEDVTEILDAIQHIKKQLIEKKKEFNERSGLRVIPHKFKGELLSDLVEWTAEQCCDLKKPFRLAAMSLVQELASLVSKCATVKDFFIEYFTEYKTLLTKKRIECSLLKDKILWLDYQTAIFDYCVWFLKQNVITVETFSSSIFEDVKKNFIFRIAREMKGNIEVEKKIKKCVLQFLNLILELKDSLPYFFPELWQFLGSVAFNPYYWGFDLAPNAANEELESILIEIFRCFSKNMTQYDWDQIYGDLEHQICFPFLHQITRSRKVSVGNSEFLFFLKVVHKSGFWNDFINRFMFSIDGSLIFEIVFRSLFMTRGKKTVAVLLDPPCRLYLEELMNLGVNVGVRLDDVFNFVGDVEPVIEEMTGKLVTKGEYFRYQFRKILSKLFRNKSKNLVDTVLNKGTEKNLNLLISILENEPRGNDDIPLEIFSRWTEFGELEVKNSFLKKKRILNKLGVVACSVLIKPGCLKSTTLARDTYSYLECVSFKEIKNDELKLICSLLPFLTDFCESEDGNPQLEIGLKQLLSESNAFCCYVFEPRYESSLNLVFSGLLKSLKLSGSLTILKTQLTVVRWFEKFSKKDEVESALSVFENLPMTHVKKALSLTYKIIMSQENSLEILRVYKWFLEPLIKVAPSEAFTQFASDNLVEFCELLSTHWIDKSSRLRDFRIDISKKIVIANIIQFFIVKLSDAQYEKLSKEKKNLFVKIVKNCFLLFQKPKPDDNLDTLMHLYQTFVCEAFKMVCSIVSSRCTDQKFYRLFVFSRPHSFLFEGINSSVKYKFGVDFDEIPKRKKIKTSIRNTSSPPPLLTGSIKQWQSNTLFTSSLQEDVTKFDLNSASIRPLNSVENFSTLEVELEIDILNEHECMPALVGIIKKMVTEKITPLPQSKEEIDELPCWLQFLVDSLEYKFLPENHELFLLKTLYNVKHYVEPYSEKVLPVVLKSVLSFFSSYDFNYFFIDLLEMMIDWKFTPGSETIKKNLTQLVLLVINKTFSLRRDIIKNNIKVVQKMIEAWKEGLDILELKSFAMKQIYREFSEDASKTDDINYIIVKVFEILMINGILPWMSEMETCAVQYFVKNLKKENRNKFVFAKACGLSLSLMECSSSPKCYENSEQLVTEIILSQCQAKVQILYAVYKHYPKILCKCIFKIFSSIWDSTDAFVAEKLEMLLCYVSDFQPIHIEIFNRQAHYFLRDTLNSSDNVVKELSLKIVYNLVNKLEKDKLKLLMMDVLPLHKSTHSNIRKLVYEVAIKFYSNLDSENSDLIKKCKMVLLKGINEEIKELENICVDFWQEFLHCSSTYKTLLKIFEEMYMPETEHIFLSNTIKMIMKTTVNPQLFENPLSQHPIMEQSTFKNRVLLLNSRVPFISGFMSSKITWNQSLEHSATLSFQKTNSFKSSSFEQSLKEKETATKILKESKVQNTNRFYKSTQKTSFSFEQWQSYKEKEEVEMEEKCKKIKIYGEYKSGDYPDIQIVNAQIIKPLKALASRDKQVARLFLVSFFSGLIEALNEEEKKIFLIKTNKIFETILQTSVSFDPNVFSFIFEITLKHNCNLNVDVELVSNAAISSNCLTLGTLIIENIIASNCDNFEDKVKRKKGFEGVEEKRWLELAKVYRSLEEFDVLSGIFLDKLHVSGEEKEAVTSETILNWLSASKQYENILKSDLDSICSEFYSESYFRCLAKLSDWSILNSCIRKTVHENLEELWKNFNLLSWFLKSEMMVSLDSEKNSFQTIMEEFCKCKKKLNVLSSNFVEELVVFDLVSEKFQRANYRIDKICLDFLAGWSHLSPWCYNLRAAKLFNLQTVAELWFAVKTLSEYSNTVLEEEIKLGCRYWEKNRPAKQDDLVTWDSKLRYRVEYLKKIKNFDLEKINAKCNMALAEAALFQNNLSLAKDCLSRVKDILPEIGPKMKVEFDYCYNLGKMAVAESKMGEEAKGVEMYLKVWKGISTEMSSAMDTNSDYSKIHLFRSNFTIAKIIKCILPVVEKCRTPEILEIINAGLELSETSENVINELKLKGLEYLEKAKDIAQTLSCTSSKSKVYFYLSEFLLKFTQIMSASDFERLATYLLKAMTVGNLESRHLFGRLLSISQTVIGSISFDSLVTQSHNVPSWMFLMWINQILASLESNLYPLLESIILRISKDYPNAVRYPFRLSKQRYKLQNSKALLFVTTLEKRLLSNLLYENFIYAMQYLSQPDSIMEYYLERILEELEEVDLKYNVISSLIEELQKLMFGNDFEIFRGNVFKFWRGFEKSINNLSLIKDNQAAVKQEIRNVLFEIASSKHLRLTKSIFSIESFCPWLKNFHAINESSELELPGQYDGITKPIQKYLVTVVSFKNEAVVLQSKRKPVQIAVLGNDAKDHKFLIKFGEDLRQDERLQKLFIHLNYKLQGNKQTNRFSIDGFKVIPLSSCLGMLEWIDCTASLHEIISDSLGNKKELILQAQNNHLTFLVQDAKPSICQVEVYLRAFSLLKRESAVSAFQLRVNTFPRDLLKNGFWNISKSPEHFVHLKKNFAVSHAVMSVVHWLVGVGDRHLQNILVSTKTGRVLGVDFGYAFGFATQSLIPPELIPFRLTPQILGLLHPLNESGWIKQTMIHCMRLFRKEKFLILSVLEVFVKEPLLEWFIQARKDSRCQVESSEVWYPKQKILTVEQKLEGFNPVATCEAELKEGHAASDCLESFIKVLKGVEQYNTRARHRSEGLLVEEQVECLIDLATDPHVLSKTYLGWNPWL